MSDTKKSSTAAWIVATVLLVGTTAIVTRTLSSTPSAPTQEHGEHAEHAEHAHDETGEHGEEGGHEHEGHGEREVHLTDEQKENAKLELGTAKPGKVFVTLSLPGEVSVDADALAHVTPRVSGTVREVKRRLGEAVKRGDVLGVIDSREIADLQRELAEAAARFDLAEKTVARLEPLHAAKVTSERDFLAAKNDLAVARIARDTAAAKVSAAGSSTMSGSYALVAPSDGTIIEKHMNIGEVVKDDTRVFVIADLERVWVDLSVYARDLPRVKVGQVVRLRADGVDAPAMGTIGFIGAVASEETRSVRARVVLDHPGEGWRPGMFATAEVAIEEVDAAIVVPDEAVHEIGGKPCVFVETDDGGYAVTEVEIEHFGRAADGTVVVEILRGLAPGARFVAKGSFTLKAELMKNEGGHHH